MAELPQLVVLHVSPWSERARWALDHHGIAYRTVQHAPFLGERRLRKLVGADAPQATVPVLVDGTHVLSQSWEIVRFADRTGSGTALVPEADEAEIVRWVAQVDAAQTHGRALVVRALLASSAALDESLPPEMPRWLRPMLRPITRHGTRWFARKYGLDLASVEEHEAAVRSLLDALRERLAGGRYLLGGFGYADIVGAAALQAIVPVDDRWFRLGPATRAVWTHPALAEPYADLIRWRDALYRDHRGGPARTDAG